MSDALPIAPYLTLLNDDLTAPTDPVVQLDIPLQPVTWRLAKGHHLQLALMSQAPQSECSTTVKIGAGQVTGAQLAPGSVASTVVADETLSLADLAGGQNNPLTAGIGMEADSCAFFSALSVPGAQQGQLVTAGWLQAPPAGVIIASTRVSGPNAVALSICNLNSTTASVPGGATFRIVTFG